MHLLVEPEPEKLPAGLRCGLQLRGPRVRREAGLPACVSVFLLPDAVRKGAQPRPDRWGLFISPDSAPLDLYLLANDFF